MKYALTFTSLLIILFSCNSVNITNEEILEICNNEQIVQDCYHRFTTRTISDWRTYKTDLKNFNELVELGLMTKSRSYQSRITPISNYNTIVEFEPTQKAIEEFNFENAGSGIGGPKGRVIFSKAKIVNVLGISIDKDQKEATAIIEVRYDKSPFSKFKSDKVDPNRCNDLSNDEIEITLKQYDTGWKLYQPIKKFPYQ